MPKLTLALNYQFHKDGVINTKGTLCIVYGFNNDKMTNFKGVEVSERVEQAEIVCVMDADKQGSVKLISDDANLQVC